MTSVAARDASDGGERGAGGSPPVQSRTRAITATRQASQAVMNASPLYTPRGEESTSTSAMPGSG